MKTPATAVAVHLHIDRLVLHGYTRIDAATITAALQAALRDRLSALPPSSRTAAVPYVRANLDLPADCSGAQLSAALACIVTDAIAAAPEHGHG